MGLELSQAWVGAGRKLICAVPTGSVDLSPPGRPGGDTEMGLVSGQGTGQPHLQLLLCPVPPIWASSAAPFSGAFCVLRLRVGGPTGCVKGLLVVGSGGLSGSRSPQAVCWAGRAGSERAYGSHFCVLLAQRLPARATNSCAHATLRADYILVRVVPCESQGLLAQD